jgi:outer membrane protein OmpA-like peptidoglycan-associated protein
MMSMRPVNDRVVNAVNRSLCLLTIMLLAACAQMPKLGDELVVVLPSASGSIGGVVVRRNNVEQVLDQPYAGSRIVAEGTPAAVTLTAAEVSDIFRAAVAALPGKPATFMLNFLDGKDELTTESIAELDSVLAEIQRRPEPDLLITGHADNVGSDGVNDKLSLARAERVRDLFVMRGIAADRIEVAGRGKRELLILTAPGVAEERNRRVEINVR